MHASTHTRSAGPGTARFEDGLTGSLHPVSNDRVSSLRDSGHSIVPYTHAGGRHSGAPRALAPLGMDTSSARGPLDSIPPAEGAALHRPHRIRRGCRQGYGGAHYTPMFPGGGGAHGPSPPAPLFNPLLRRQTQQLPSLGSVGGGRDTYNDRGSRTRRPMTTQG